MTGENQMEMLWPLYQRLIEFSGDAVYTYTYDEGVIVFANEGLVRVLDLDCKPEELVGRKLADVLVYTEKPGVVREAANKKGEIHNFDYHFKTLKGEDRWVVHDSFVSIEPDSGRKIVEAIVKDITERKRAELKIERLNKVLRTINNINQLIANERDTNKLLQQTCSILLQNRDYKMIWIGMIDNAKKQIVPVARSGSGTDYLDSITIIMDEREAGRDVFNNSIKTRKPIIFNNIAGEPLLKAWEKNLLERGFVASMTAPIAHEDRVFGIITIYAGQLNVFDQEEVSLINELAQDLGLSLQSSEDSKKRWEADAALKISEQNFREIFDNAADGILLADMESKMFFNCNKAAHEMLGYTLGELKKMGVMDIHPKNDIPYVLKQFEKQTKKEIVMAKNIPVLRKDGSVFFADINSSSIQIGNKKYLMGIFRDITQRKLIEEKLEESEKRLKSIYESMNEGLALHQIIYDSDGKAIDYLVIEVNPAYERILGINRAKAVGSKGSVLYGQTNPPYLEIYSRVAATGESEYFEDDFEPMAKRFSVSVFSPGKGVFATIFSDITERKKWETSLEKKVNELEKYQTILVGREDRILELKKQVKELKLRLGEAS